MADPAAHELLSALLDREPVDPDLLANLLDDPEARALLVDFVRLRVVLHGDTESAEPAPRRAVPRRRSAGAWVLRVAAALLLLALGAVAGRRFALGDLDTPPEPTRVVQLAPARGAR
jgi:hypothetical protein